MVSRRASKQMIHSSSDVTTGEDRLLDDDAPWSTEGVGVLDEAFPFPLIEGWPFDKEAPIPAAGVCFFDNGPPLSVAGVWPFHEETPVPAAGVFVFDELGPALSVAGTWLLDEEAPLSSRSTCKGMAGVWLFKNDPLWYKMMPVPFKALFELIQQAH
jgi:hypothetical protein